MLVIDSHTEGEPTRVIVEGGPDLGSGPLSERAARLANEFTDAYRSVVAEPYGQEAMVGALLVTPTNPDCVTGVIYFDAAAVIGMCGHGTIGLAVTLAYLGKIGIGKHKIETPVGIVEIELTDNNTVTVTNVESYRFKKAITVEVDNIGKVTGDIAYGGNWCFIVNDSPTPVRANNIRHLTAASIAIRQAIYEQKIQGFMGSIIDHIILYGAAQSTNSHTRNFVLCPDNSYDRSPCGTGSSARLACLAADNLLNPGEAIYQESIIGSGYTLSYQYAKTLGTQQEKITPSITGQAFITRETTLIDNPGDPLKHGINFEY